MNRHEHSSRPGWNTLSDYLGLDAKANLRPPSSRRGDIFLLTSPSIEFPFGSAVVLWT
jgi:hypothetical protein